MFLEEDTNLIPSSKSKALNPKNESLKLHLVRKKVEYEYTDIIFANELVKFGYEWIQIHEIISKHKGFHTQEVKLEIQTLINKVKKLNFVPSIVPSQPSTLERTSMSIV